MKRSTIGALAIILVFAGNTAFADSCANKKSRECSGCNIHIRITVKNDSSQDLNVEWYNWKHDVYSKSAVFPDDSASRVTGVHESDDKDQWYDYYVVVKDGTNKALCNAEVRNSEKADKSYFNKAECSEIPEAYNVSCDRSFQAGSKNRWHIKWTFTDAS